MIGIEIDEPKEKCTDPNCPFHGQLKVRGIIIKGKVETVNAQKTVVIKRQRLHYLPKYERYEKRTGRYQAHLPPCLSVDKGEDVVIMECRPISKTKHFVVVAKQ